MSEKHLCRGQTQKRHTSSLAGLLSLISLSIPLATAGCWMLPPPASDVAGLVPFESPAAFKQYLADQVKVRGSQPVFNGDVMLFGMPGLPMGGPVPDAVPAPMGVPGAASPEGSFSTTNLQEAGVDEGDVVKNDGTYLYILSNEKLQIVRAVPVEDMAVVSSVDLPIFSDSGSSSGAIAPFFFPSVDGSLYLSGDKVIAILSSGFDARTAVVIINAADRSKATIEATLKMDGSLVSSRLIGAKLHLILSFSPVLPLDRTEQAIGDATIDDLIPDMTLQSADGSETSDNLVAWQDFFHPLNDDGYNVTAVVTVDVDDPQKPVESTALMADASTVYASTEALYLTNGDYDYQRGRSREKTEVYKFNLADDGADLAGAGIIPGRLLNRFSLGEYQGHLRAATTNGHVSRDGQSKVSNNIYVLGEADGALKIVGKIEDIAPGEQIHSARFIGERGFLVTFKKVDPLFTLDLSDPAAPRLVGRLKVPGFSDYIQLLDENHLLTIGKDAVDMGGFAWFQGVQISVFDVTQFDKPTLVDAEVIGDRGTDSEALREPHAFNFFQPQHMLAVPMSIAEGAGPDPSSFGTQVFEGLTLFHVDAEAGIEPAGRIETAPAAPEAYPFHGGWTRGVFMGDHVFAITPSAVLSVPVDAPDVTPTRLPLK